ncbi:electron transfer flavoprotein beta subunit lysine methyltransferase-like [Labrus bergylta]|uniref:electron transfer flavoprotein beta subunit lysine methyltransferase-like n=1 Tax=Labrus bergylta TaxID=56723 RepID=UPI0033141F11
MFGLFKSSTWSRCVKGSFTAFRRRCVSHSRRFIGENTEVVGEQSLTPELRLRLFTPSCRFWTERPELWPYEDPYWAIYWPGGQALSRPGEDTNGTTRRTWPQSLKARCWLHEERRLELGLLCLSLRDRMWVCKLVAAVATHMNSELNGLQPPVCLTHNIMGSPPAAFHLILLGDMFYDQSLATSLHSWLNRCMETHGTKVLIGDPGRAQFEEHAIRRLLRPLAQFELPDSVREENYSLSCSGVWSYTPEL